MNLIKKAAAELFVDAGVIVVGITVAYYARVLLIPVLFG